MWIISKSFIINTLFGKRDTSDDSDDDSDSDDDVIFLSYNGKGTRRFGSLQFLPVTDSPEAETSRLNTTMPSEGTLEQKDDIST